jgi:hypothetical protein
MSLSVQALWPFQVLFNLYSVETLSFQNGWQNQADPHVLLLLLTPIPSNTLLPPMAPPIFPPPIIPPPFFPPPILILKGDWLQI